MSTITFSSDGSYFTVQADDQRICGEQKFFCETWYEGEPPAAIDSSLIYKRTKCDGSTPVYWLVRRPLPVLPSAKSQEDIDNDAFTAEWDNCQYKNRHVEFETVASRFWYAGMRWERSRK